MRTHRLLPFCLIFLVTHAHAFGVDVCFKDPGVGAGIIQNCINVDESCRTDNLNLGQEMSCRANALIDSLSGLSGSKAIIGGRSLLHSDSTYLMAQLIGFTPWQAYQIMIYSEATDQSQYTAFDQQGSQILSNDEIAACRGAWGSNMPHGCLLISQSVNGLYKFNAPTGGMLLHIHALYSPNGTKAPAVNPPGDYLAPNNLQYDPLLSNFQDWVFGARSDLCAGGITQVLSSSTSSCERSTHVLKSPVNFFASNYSPLAIPFVTTLGTFIINEDDTRKVLATNTDFQSYLTPQDSAYAKMGIFLHTLQDRYSHHFCTDNSYFYKDPTGNYNSNYSSIYCAQGSHFLWHAWEQGTLQTDKNLNPKFQTMRPALSAAYNQLLAYATYLNIPVNTSIDEQTLIDNLIQVLQVSDPQERLNNMVLLTEHYAVLPLPGHGSAATYSIDEWLTLAGAPIATSIKSK